MIDSNVTPQGGANELLAKEAAMMQQPVTDAGSFNFRDYIVDLTKEAEKPDYLLEIDGVGVVPRGGITAVTGQAKHGKTSFLSVMVATLMSGKPFGRMRRRASAIGTILWVDTEQAEFNIHETIGRVYKQAGIPEHSAGDKYGLHVLKLRPLDPQRRLLMVQQAVEALNPEILVIDGLRDLINDINDIAESNDAVNWLLGMLDARPQMCIFDVLHTNTGTDKMRGHIGTELMNKCQDRFTCVKENGIFKVEHETRGREVQIPFVFCIGGDGILMPSTIEQSEGVMDAETALLEAVPVEGASWETIVAAYKKHTRMSERAARDALKQRMNNGELVQVGRGVWKLKNRP